MANPIVKSRDRAPTLTCSKGYGPCDLCRGLKRKHAIDASDTVHAAALDASDEKQTEWTLLFNVQVATKNGDDPTAVEGYAEQQAAASRGPITTIDGGTQLAIIERVHVSNFWPKADLVSTLSMTVVDSQLETGTDSFGNKCLGMIRKASADDPDPLPRGVKQVFKEEKHYRKQNTVVHSSKIISVLVKVQPDGHTRNGQWTSVWKKWAMQELHHRVWSPRAPCAEL